MHFMSLVVLAQKDVKLHGPGLRYVIVLLG
jgi:hypothetical protein